MKTLQQLKTVAFSLCLGVAMMSVTSCGSEKNSETGGIPFRSSENGKWGMVSSDGKIIFEDEFKDCPTSVHNGLCMVKNGQGLWEIYTAEQKTEKVGDEYMQLGDFYADVAPAVKKNERITLINTKGEVVATLEKDGSRNISGVSNFSYGYAKFQAGDDYGMIDTKGNVVIPAKYFFIAPLPSGKFVALDSKYKNEEKKNSVISILNTKGDVVTSIKLSKYDDIGDFDEIVNFGCIPVKVTADGESQWGMIDINGEVIFKPSGKIRQLGKLVGDNFTFNDGSGWGVRNLKDEVVLRPKYSQLVWATEKLLWAFDNNNGKSEWTLVDLEGNEITKDTYIDVMPFFDGEYAAVKITDKSWGFIDKEGKELKGTPDIYELRDHHADEWLVSDFIDLDAIVSDLKITEKSLGDFALDMTAAQVAKVFAENNYEEGKERIEATPDGIGARNSLSYDKVIEGATVSYTLGYADGEYIAEGGESRYDPNSMDWITTNATWANVKPAYIGVSISGDKISGRTKELFSHVATSLKAKGKVFKENPNAIIVSIGNGQKGYVAYNNGRSIEIAIFASDGYKDYRIDQFANVSESANTQDTDNSEELYQEPSEEQVMETEDYSEEDF